jgi:hypothetical protein
MGSIIDTFAADLVAYGVIITTIVGALTII